MLVDLSVKQFLNKVLSCDPIPGGGSIAALSAAIAAALSSMVAGVPIGKMNYEKHEG